MTTTATHTQINEWVGTSTVLVLKELLAKAEIGEVTGLAFACKLGDHDHGIGLTGDYSADPAPVLGVGTRLLHLVNEKLDQMATTKPSKVVPLRSVPEAS